MNVNSSFESVIVANSVDFFLTYWNMFFRCRFFNYSFKHFMKFCLAYPEIVLGMVNDVWSEVLVFRSSVEALFVRKRRLVRRELNSFIYCTTRNRTRRNWCWRRLQSETLVMGIASVSIIKWNICKFFSIHRIRTI